MKTELCGLIALAVLVLAGCSTPTTVIFDPESQRTNVRSSHGVSSEEYREVTRFAAREVLGHPKFVGFLERYKVEMKDPFAIPVMKVDKVVNDTDDPDLNVTEMTDMLNEVLLNSGKVDITMAEGVGRSAAIGNSRNLEDDDNFAQSTVAKRGRLKAARLIMRPKVISNKVSDGAAKVVTRTFVIEIADIDTGMIMFRVTKQLGFVKHGSAFGY